MRKSISKVFILSIVVLFLLSTVSFVRASSVSNIGEAYVKDLEEVTDEKEMPNDELIELGSKNIEELQKSEKKIEANNSTSKVEEPKVQKPEVETPKTETPQVQEPSFDVPQVSEPSDEPEIVEPLEQPEPEKKPAVQNGHKHTYGPWEVTFEPTCISLGEKTRKCTVCGEVETTTFMDMNAHRLETIEDVAPTCETYGKKDCTKCVLCNQEFFRYVAPLGHNWSTNYTVDKEATCTQDGIKSKHCTREGCHATSSQVVIKATGHNLVNVVKEGTCTTKGTSSTECTKCGYVAKTVVTSQATGHKYGKYVSDNNATCAADGTKTATCEVCGHKNTVTDVGSKKNHNFVELDDFVYPTCEKSGREASQRCTICGKVNEGKTIPASGHQFVLMGATVSENPAANQTIKCIKCHIDYKDGKYTFGTGHQWNEDGTECVCGDPHCQAEKNSTWWKTWKEEEDRKACIWFAGFTCDMTQCNGFSGHGSQAGRKVDTVLEGRRGDVGSITMTAPQAKDGWVFDGWYEVTADGKGKKVSSSPNSNGTSATGTKITVGWKDMDKGFEARYRKAS